MRCGSCRNAQEVHGARFGPSLSVVESPWWENAARGEMLREAMRRECHAERMLQGGSLTPAYRLRSVASGVRCISTRTTFKHLYSFQPGTVLDIRSTYSIV